MTVLPATAPRPEGTSGHEAALYLDLRRAVAQAGLLEPAYGYYAALATVWIVALAGGLALLFRPPSLPSAFLSVLLVTGARVQLALIGHDAAHGAVFRSARRNHLAAAVCWSLVAGIGWQYWRRRHNQHHGHTNDSTADPDVLPSLLDRVLRKSGLLVTLLSLVLSSVTFRVEGWLYSVHALRGRRRVAELLSLAANAAAWAATIALLHWYGLALFAASEVLSSLYLAAIVAPNHRGMPAADPRRTRGFVAEQVTTSRDLVDHPFWNVFYGGLNAQIEHHLFPSMPRPHLSGARPIVREFCRRHALPYETLRPGAAYRRVIAAALVPSPTLTTAAMLEGDSHA